MKIQKNRIYWAPTFAKNDVDKKGNPKMRPTFVLEEMTKVCGKRIFLVASVNSKASKSRKISNWEFKVTNFVSPKNNARRFVKGYISPINIRFVSEDAFKIYDLKSAPFFLVKNSYFLRKKCLSVLIDLKNGRYKYYRALLRHDGMHFDSKKELNSFLQKGQFDEHELKAKGFLIQQKVRKLDSIYVNKWEH